ncbi:MAG TPA: transposase [Chitinophagales bacterium]|nr:transposase [Chitinophagales bacterium]
MEKTLFLESGSVYHIYNRGTNKQTIFITKKDYNHFLSLWEKHIEPVADTFAFCLLPNHFHFMVKIKEITDLTQLPKAAELNESDIKYYLSRQFSNLFNAYSRYFNLKYERDGKVFRERFKRKEVLTEEYFTKLIEYIHTNPVKHGITDNYKDYEYSSFWIHVLDTPTRLKRDEIIKWYGSKSRYINSHDTYEVVK